MLASPSSFSFSIAPSAASSSRAVPNVYHPTLVGPRSRFAADGSSTTAQCSTDELLEAIKGAKVRPDGASTHPNFGQPKTVELEPIEWSFDLPRGGAREGEGAGVGRPATSCEMPKVYSAEEACELLSAFGGCATFLARRPSAPLTR